MAEFDRAKIEKFAGFLRHGKGECPSAFLIGAGASLSAGIPSAAGLVKQIHEKFPHLLEGLTPDEKGNYGICMEKLSPPEREGLIRPYLANAKLNWGHIALAQLIAKGYVNRVLSFNFDLLLEKAASLLGLQIPVYDFATAPQSDIDRMADPAIVHLHGQSYGFTMLNSDEETRKHRDSLRPLYNKTLQRQPLFVIGYSGKADASLETLEEEASRHRLVWMGYSDTPDPVLGKLLARPYAEYFGNADFDRTMIALAQELGCWEPQVVRNPLRHLITEFEPVADYPLGAGESDILALLRQRLAEEAEAWDLKKDDPASQIFSEAFKAPGSRKKTGDVRTGDPKVDAALADIRAWTAISEGNALADQAGTKTGVEADRLFAEAAGKYKAALAIKPDKHEALFNWGIALADQAETKAGAEADRLFAEAGEKYKASLAIKPGRYEVLYNWGNALTDRAETKAGAEADRLFAEAAEKYKAALAIKPDKHEALFNWGIALADQARMKAGAEADRLFAEAAEKYKAALAIKPDKHEALYNWGTLLIDQARTKTGAEADRLLAEAEDKIRQALVLDDSKTYNLACLLALRGRNDEALGELEKAHGFGTLPDRKHLETDPDLSGLHKLPRFKALLKKAKQ